MTHSADIDLSPTPFNTCKSIWELQLTLEDVLLWRIHHATPPPHQKAADTLKIHVILPCLHFFFFYLKETLWAKCSIISRAEALIIVSHSKIVGLLQYFLSVYLQKTKKVKMTVRQLQKNEP